MRVGIHDIAAATGSLVLDLAQLAEKHGIELAKFQKGLGQYEMSITTRDEDIVTMGALAARKIIDRHGAADIRTVLFATESGVDQSKAAGVFMHGLLDLPKNCRVIELKEACYSATAALQFAAGLIARKPDEKVLVIASDTARYEIDSSGEPTQGCGAIAMLVSKDPAMLEFEAPSGLWTSDVMDFWRPNDRSTALVDGHYSTRVYLDSLEMAWNDFSAQGGVSFDQIDTICYHQPFTKMAAKAHKKLAQLNGVEDLEAAVADIDSTMIYNRRLGNTYTASVFYALLSWLDNGTELAGKRVGLFSYGSGSVSEFFTAVVVEGYQDSLRVAENQAMLDARKQIQYDEYRQRHIDFDRLGAYTNDVESMHDLRFVGVQDNIREYAREGTRSALR